MNWSVNAGATIRGCQAPSTVSGDSGQVLDGEAWQDFLRCLFGSQNDPFKSEFGPSHPSLAEKESATGYVALAHERFSLSADALELTPLAKLERLYEAVTFRSISVSDRAKLNTALANLSYDQVLNSFLSKWFNSTSYSSHYDYGANVYIGKSWFKITGSVQDNDGNAISAASLALKVGTGQQILREIASQSDGSYEILIELDNDIFAREVDLVLEVDGYVTRSYRIPLEANQITYSHNFQTVLLGKADPNKGVKFTLQMEQSRLIFQPKQ